MQPAVGRSSRDAAFALLEEASASGQPRRSLAAELQRLGALAAEAADSPVCAFSHALADALPKHWGGGGAVSEQLAAKQQRHGLLLRALGQAGALAQLPPSSLRTLFDNGEKLAAVAAVYAAQDGLRAAQRDAPELGWLQAAVDAAGKSVRSQGVPQSRADWELFYAKPTQTAAALLPAAAAQLPAAAAQLEDSAHSYAWLRALASVAMEALAAAAQQQAAHRQAFGAQLQAAEAAGLPGWAADALVRGALLQMGRHLSSLLPSLESEVGREACGLLAALADLLLNAHAAALAAGDGPQLAREYASARQELLQTLLDCACGLCEAGEPDGEALLQRVQATAEAHRGYAQLFDVAQFRGDRSLLYSWMEALQPAAAGPGDGGFAAFVFARLRDGGRLGELLQLPDEFGGALAAWLDAQGGDPATLRLRWLHAARMGRTAAAAAALAQLVQRPAAGAPLSDARADACLSKLAALAAQQPGGRQPSTEAAESIRQANARLTQVRVQEQLGRGGQELQPPQALFNAAIEGRQSADCCFDLLAAGGAAFRADNRAAWADALRKLVTDFEWQALHARAAALAEAEAEQLLAATPLARVALLSYSGAAAAAHSDAAGFAADFPCAEAGEILREAAQQHCPAAERDIAAAFRLGCEAQYV